jgi:hypothetical protein
VGSPTRPSGPNRRPVPRRPACHRRHHAVGTTRGSAPRLGRRHRHGDGLYSTPAGRGGLGCRGPLGAAAHGAGWHACGLLAV